MKTNVSAAGDRDRNLVVSEARYEQREAIEVELGAALDWGQLATRRAKRISLYAPFPISILTLSQNSAASWRGRCRR